MTRHFIGGYKVDQEAIERICANPNCSKHFTCRMECGLERSQKDFCYCPECAQEPENRAGILNDNPNPYQAYCKTRFPEGVPT